MPSYVGLLFYKRCSLMCLLSHGQQELSESGSLSYCMEMFPRKQQQMYRAAPQLTLPMTETAI